MWGSEFFFKRRYPTGPGDDGGAHAIVRGGARCASQVLHRCALAVSRGAARARCASQVLGRGAHGAHAIVRGGALVVRRRYFIVAPRPFPAAPLVVHCR